MKFEPLHQNISKICQEHPKRIAINYKEKLITYSELDQESNRIANCLHQQIKNQTKNPHVIVILDRSPELIHSIMGIFKSGLIFIPFDSKFPEYRLKVLLQETQSEWIITSSSFFNNYKKVIQEEEREINVLLTDGDNHCIDISRKTKIFCHQSENSALNFKEIDSKYCYIYFTSGSTGVPKGVLGRHKSLSHFIQWEIQEFGVNEHFKVSQLTNPAFDPFLRDIFVPLVAGGTICIPDYETLMNAEKLINWIDQTGVNFIHIVPSLFKELQNAILHSDCLVSVKNILFAGELLRGNDIKKFIKIFADRIQLVNLYGPTETTLAKFFYRISKEDFNKPIIPVGKTIPGSQVLILNAEMKKCLAGNIGEIYIRTPFISAGYYNDKELTRQVFKKNPFGNHPQDIIYKTGDLGRLLPDGNVELVGRVDHQVKIRGHRIEMGEIENHLLAYDGIKTVVVNAFVGENDLSPDDKGEEKKLGAYIVKEESRNKKKEFNSSHLRAHLVKLLPTYMVPSYFVFLDKMPLSPNGKVDRKSLPLPKIEDAYNNTPFEAPKDEYEKRIAQIWKKILKVEKIGINHNFFELGGNSLRIMEMVSKLTKEFRKDIPVTKLFEYTTVASQAAYLRELKGNPKGIDSSIKKISKTKKPKGENAEIAVIGLSCRFPGSNNIDEYWKNLKEGRESITFYSNEELLNAGVNPDWLNHPNYVRAASQITEKEYFDARFFGYTPREAELLDPQIRVFHECSWEALEDSGINQEEYEGLIGVYAGAVHNLEWELRAAVTGKSNSFGSFAASKLTGIRYLCTRLSYNLNLKGPSVTMQTACSTSLVAIHMACQALAKGECDLAIAGGVTVSSEGKWGYLYEENMIFSSDGHCRSFDAKGNGTVFGEGIGIVVLKPIEEAIADRDHIYAVIKGTAINNDGNRKVGFTAPSVSGQVEVIHSALEMARVELESIGYIETHGTATSLGDPIEIEALEQVFGSQKGKLCKIGSVKSNFGHLDAAAGVAGFIKAVLALKYKQIPPSLLFESSNSAIHFEKGPFEVNTQLLEWKNEKYPLRAAVTSLGMGGTNAHVILEEAPKREESSKDNGSQILPLSAKNEVSLNLMATQLAYFLKNNPEINLADVAYTLQTGRKKFIYRRMMVCSSIHEAIEKLSEPVQKNFSTEIEAKDENPAIVFMFPGQGSQYLEMGLELYRREPVFQKEMDHCFTILNILMDIDLKEVLYPHLNLRDEGKLSLKSSDINQTEIAQPLIFVLEYALAKLLINWGIKPNAMIGHSIGEYTAACLSGVLSLEDTLKLIVHRGKLMQKMPNGAMLSVPIAEEELKPLLIEQLELAAVNSSNLCVVSGPCEAVDGFAEKLKNKGFESRKLVTKFAFHSRLMDPILPEFEKELKNFRFQEPEIPYISNLTGDWITMKNITTSNYWSRHLRETVSFSKGLEKLFDLDYAIFMEVGPGNALSKFVNLHSKKSSQHRVMNLVRHPHENISDSYYLFNKIGQLWIHGHDIDWNSLHSDGRRNRLSIPTYAFDRKYYWIEKVDYNTLNHKPPAERKKNMADWFYIPSWKRSVVLPENKIENNESWNLIFMDECSIGSGLLKKYNKEMEKSIRVISGSSFSENSDFSFTINPESDDDYEKLFKRLIDSNQVPQRVIHFWNISGTRSNELSIESTQKAQTIGYYSLINIAKVIGNLIPENNVDIIVFTDNLYDVKGTECIDPEKSTILGPIGVIPQEYSNIQCRCVDIVLPENLEKENPILLSHIYNEINHPSEDKIVAYRDKRRWVHFLEPVKLSGSQEIPPILKNREVYLITGGLGGMGLVFAEYLSKTIQPRLIITGRSDFPPKEKWDHWLQDHGPEDRTSEKIAKLKLMEENGTQILYLQVDVSNQEEMENKLNVAEREMGEIKGIIHAAGIADFAGIIHRRSKEDNEEIFTPKLNGTLTIDKIFRTRKLDFMVLISSMSSLCAHFGQVGYSSANAFLDSYAAYKAQADGTFTISINWDNWREVGMAAKGNKQKRDANQLVENGISSDEGVEVFARALNYDFPNLAVSTIDFNNRLATQQIKGKEKRNDSLKKKGTESSLTKSEEFIYSYNTDNTPEEKMTEIWRELLGHEQIKINDNFFELGGDSLTAIHMRKKITEIFNMDIPLVKIYHFPTIQLLVENIFNNDNESETHPINNPQVEEIEEVEEELDEMLEKFEEI